MVKSECKNATHPYMVGRRWYSHLRCASESQSDVIWRRSLCQVSYAAPNNATGSSCSEYTGTMAQKLGQKEVIWCTNGIVLITEEEG